MIEPDIPENEEQRQAAVEKYNLLDTIPEEEYDNITSLMSYICDCPISLITLLDKERNFLKSHHGIPINESPRKLSFCGHAINTGTPITIIEDARTDERFSDNPLVTEQKAIFYAGVPLVDTDGHKLGTLCVYDVKPRVLNDAQRKALLDMSKQVMKLFEERHKNIQLVEMQTTLEKRNENLKRFARIISHDLKSPLSNIIALVDLLEQENRHLLKLSSVKYIDHLRQSSKSMKEYIDGLLLFYQAEEILKLEPQKIDFTDLMEELRNLVVMDDSVRFEYHSNCDVLNVKKAALMQILINLITNGLKYNHKTDRSIKVECTQDHNYYHFEVTDNGDGIPSKEIATLFDMFTTGESKDRYGFKGTGIGLTTARKIVEDLGGTILVNSTENIGSAFKFTVRQ